MSIEEQLLNAAFREGEKWSRSVYVQWMEHGWCLPSRWPYSIEDAVVVLGVSSKVNPQVRSWLAALLDAGARRMWCKLRRRGMGAIAVARA